MEDEKKGDERREWWDKSVMGNEREAEEGKPTENFILFPLLSSLCAPYFCELAQIELKPKLVIRIPSRFLFLVPSLFQKWVLEYLCHPSFKWHCSTNSSHFSFALWLQSDSIFQKIALLVLLWIMVWFLLGELWSRVAAEHPRQWIYLVPCLPVCAVQHRHLARGPL